MASLGDLADRVWYGDSPADRAARAALAPLGWLFGAVAAGRSRLYDTGILTSEHLALPSISVGNLTVGGTGKTPVAAWMCGTLLGRGLRTAIVLRGVGGDEARVHALLNPDVIVVCDPDRVRGVATAASLGAEVAVLDDAFQHRRARRDVDVVLVSAERFGADVRSLPAGPYRERLGALARAQLVCVTRKSASRAAADAACARLVNAAGDVAVAQLYVSADRIRRWVDDGMGDERALDVLAGEDVLVVAGIGEPGAFAAQIERAGARVTLARYADHHAYTAGEVAALVARGEGVGRIVTTLKDAVKLGPMWPRRAPPLWYVSQRVIVERGGDAIARALDAIASRAPVAPSGTRASMQDLPAVQPLRFGRLAPAL